MEITVWHEPTVWVYQTVQLGGTHVPFGSQVWAEASLRGSSTTRTEKLRTGPLPAGEADRQAGRAVHVEGQARRPGRLVGQLEARQAREQLPQADPRLEPR